ncbi:MAG: bifunctional diaminohydroxyphosphoribosylaminopyrimidine deaminase/5-amino-6-(5-phosphoribosylamino)uracil reductase RibD [Bdellovibrionota bacterium]
MGEAINKASLFIGATAPNPPVGAVGLSADGGVISAQAHEKAGAPHAEAKVIEDCARRGILNRLDTLIITLEPCNHHGRTPPCTELIKKANVKNVFYGSRDPNPLVMGNGAEALKDFGINVHEWSELCDDKDVLKRCRELIGPFTKLITLGVPYITIKTAYRHDSLQDNLMIPPVGQKTFTSTASLRFAHELRKCSDAIITGSGTVLADKPLFSVRHIPDHPGKQRWLVVLDRRGRIRSMCQEWLKAAELRGVQVIHDLDLEQAIRFLGQQGVLMALVEAGPTLTNHILSTSIWDRHVIIRQGNNGNEDLIEDVYRHC